MKNMKVHIKAVDTFGRMENGGWWKFLSSGLILWDFGHVGTLAISKVLSRHRNQYFAYTMEILKSLKHCLMSRKQLHYVDVKAENTRNARMTASVSKLSA